MASRLFFNGRSYSTPVVVSKVSDSAMAPSGLTTGNTLCIIGPADGGNPQQVYSFSDPAAVDVALVSGPLHHAVRKAFSVSAEVPAPGTILAVRVGAAVAAKANIAASGTYGALGLVAANPGILGNGVVVTIGAGSVAGYSARIVPLTGATIFQDNIAQASFSVSYSGSQPSATVAVSNTPGSPATITLSAPAGTAVGTINTGSYATVQAVCAAINAIPGFSASAAAAAGNLPTTGVNVVPPFDTLTAASCFNASVTVRADAAALNSYFLSGAQNLVTSAGGNSSAGPYQTPATLVLSGGSASAPLLADWTNALSALQAQKLQWLVPLSGDPAVHAAVDAHVQFMSTQGMAERRAFVGPSIGTTETQAEALPLALNSDRTAMVFPGHYDFNAAGVLTLFDSFYSAVLVAAGFAGLSPGQSMTNKSLQVQGMELKLQNPVDTDALIQAGIIPLMQTSTGYEVVRAVSTWLVDNKFDRVEVSCGAATDFVASNARAALQSLKGRRGAPNQLARAYNAIETCLQQLAKPAPAGPEVLVGDAINPPFQNITVALNGDTITAGFECSPVIPTNFVAVTIAAVPYSGTASS